LCGSLFAASVGALATSGTLAAPDQTTESQGQNQNVDYLGAEAAASLNLDFPVLVPSYVPGPFGGEPAVRAGGGSYSLYWMNVDTTPTFLYVEGEVGGSLPAGSPADLNNELTINASVQGHDAIHDVTAKYDAVWWISGGVLYTVQSRNMETDSLSLANSLVQFVTLEETEPEPETPVEQLPPEAGGGMLEPPTDAPDVPDVTEEPTATEPIAATEPEQEVVDDAVAPEDEVVASEVVEETEPVTTEPVATEPVATEAEDAGADGTGSESTVAGQVPPTQAPTLEPTAQDQEGSQETAEEIATVEPATDQPEPIPVSGGAVGSDGTGGAPLPVFGGDGTGGTRDLTLPVGGD